MTRKCSSCKKEKKKDEFQNSSWIKPNHYNVLCRECNNREKRERTRMTKKDSLHTGYIYIVINPAWDGWCKIGKATEINGRLSGYQTSSPFRDYEVYYSVKVKTTRIELKIHDKLKKLGIEHNSEWFYIDKEIAVSMIKEEL